MPNHTNNFVDKEEGPRGQREYHPHPKIKLLEATTLAALETATNAFLDGLGLPLTDVKYSVIKFTMSSASMSVSATDSYSVLIHYLEWEYAT